MFLLNARQEAGLPIIKIAGIGGAGIHILHELNEYGLAAEYLAFDSSAACLASTAFASSIQIGRDLTNNLGCGARPEIGRQAALNNRKDILNSLQDIDLLILVAGLGGGLGSGAITIIAEVARELGIPTLCFVTKPFKFEGKKRTQIANQTIDELNLISNGVLAIDHNKLLDAFAADISLIKALQQGANHLQLIIKQLMHIIETNSLINVDFADIRTLFSYQGSFAMGTIQSHSNQDLFSLIQQVLRHPLVELSPPYTAKGILLFIDAGDGFNLDELFQASDYMKEISDEKTEVIMGINNTPSSSGISVTVLATGIIKKEHKPVLIQSRRM